MVKGAVTPKAKAFPSTTRGVSAVTFPRVTSSGAENLNASVAESCCPSSDTANAPFAAKFRTHPIWAIIRLEGQRQAYLITSAFQAKE